ncbi:MAG: LacI family transcriptional regulator [Treponema sp.]|jgi:LacI family transcriptional regulator|nr:LacI family transcriptional regulator [Treponema sp.]
MSSITIKDVAKTAQVSVGTASMALNGKQRVKPRTREKVLAVAESLGYHPNKYARLLSGKRTMVVGLIITDITNPFFGIIIDMVQEELARQGYDIFLEITKGSITKEQHFIKKFIEMKTDAVIIVPSHKQAPNTAHLQTLRSRRIPFCFITAYYSGVSAPCVMTDLSEGSYLLTKYLLERGHRKIMYIIANRAIPVSNLRAEGFLRAYRETGIPFSPEFLVISEPSFQGGYHSTSDIIKKDLPDAILTMNDIMAMGVLKKLKEHAIRVPEDISVAGYDDLLYASLLETPLTTVRQPMEQMCKKTVELILSKIEMPDDINEKILISPQLIIRDSTADKTVAPVHGAP